MLNAAAIVLASVYLFALLPVVFVGFVANADYGYLVCPGAVQCSDAASARTIAVFFVLAAPIVWLLFKALRTAARALQPEEDA